jgi:type IV pilus assembly protein PilA
MRIFWFVSALCFFSCAFAKGPPKDGECRANLRSAMALQLSFKESTGAFSPHPALIGFSPSSGNRYLYWFSTQGPISRRDGKQSPPATESVGIGPDFSRGETIESLWPKIPLGILNLAVANEKQVVMGCAGNIDADETIDIWTISSEERIFDGVKVSQGTAYRHVNDREN